MSRTSTKKTSRKDPSPKSKKENNEKGWRDVLVWIIPLGMGFVLAAIGIIYFLNTRLAIVLIVLAGYQFSRVFSLLG